MAGRGRVVKGWDDGYCEGYAMGYSDGYYNGIAAVIKFAKDAQEIQRLRDNAEPPAKKAAKAKRKGER